MSELASAGRRLRRTVESARVSDRLVLVPHRSVPAPRTPFVALMVTLLALGVVGLLMFNTQMQQRSFAITRLQKQAVALDATVQQLRTRQQTLQDPQHLAAAAKALGMVVPPNPAFIHLGSGRLSGVPVITSMGDGMQIRQSPTPKPAHLNPPPKIVRVPASTTTTTATTTTTGTKKSSSTGAASTSERSGHGRNNRTTHHR